MPTRIWKPPASNGGMQRKQWPTKLREWRQPLTTTQWRTLALSLSRGKLRWRTCFVSISSEHPSNPDPVARRETTAECRGTPDVKPFSCSTPSPTQLDSLENSLGHSGAVGSSVQKYPVTWKIKRRKRKSAWRHKPESTAAKVS